MAPRGAKKPREERPSAVVIAFPLVARREPSARLPFTVVPVHHSEPIASTACPSPASQNDRPALPLPKRGWLWEAAIAVSILAHTGLGFMLWERNNYDLERAAGAAAAAADDGAVVIPIEVVVSAALPSAEKPVETTTPDEKQITKTAPETQEKTDKQEEKETAPPQKSDDAMEVVKQAKESPKPEREKKEHKKKQTSAASRTAAADPNHAAASRSEGRAGAGGRGQFGGHANTSSYQALVQAHLQRYKFYPAAARSSGIRGMAIVRFSLAASGAVISASLARGSGTQVLDQAALEWVRRASPFPPIPSNLGKSRMDFAAPIRFDLQ